MEEKNKPSKQCRVCGDVAFSFNFNGLCCDPCKVFFRRNAARDESFICSQRGNCVIDIENRKKCKRCRLDKCLAIGMKKEIIWCTKINKPKADNDENNIENQSENSNINLSKDVKILQNYDLERIHEAQLAMSVFSNANSAKVVGAAQNLIQVANVAEIYVKKMIKFCKCFGSFKSLDAHNQMALLKPLYPEMALVYLAFMYDEQRDGLNVLTNDSGDQAFFVKMDFSAELKRKEIITSLRIFSTDMHREMQCDPAIRDLIITQLLFKCRDNVTCPEFVRYNNFVYRHLLQRYLVYKYRDEVAADRVLTSIMNILDRINVWSMVLSEVFHNEVDAQQILPVVAELFDLNQTN